jgi:hypothetical protein
MLNCVALHVNLDKILALSRETFAAYAAMVNHTQALWL